MRAVIISAGTISDYAYAKSLIRDGDFIICADGGLRHAEAMGVSPDLCIGDFDSLGTVPNICETLVLPQEKDYTDTHTAALEAKNRGAKELLLLGASGTRLDHTIANIGLLEAVRRLGMKAVLADKNNNLFIAESGQKIRVCDGESVSLIPLSEVRGVTLQGFKYPLTNADIELFNPIWVSNELSDAEGEITFADGVLLVDISRD